ncbi:response regulator [Pseudobacteroides cellulosolvens]|uniref:Stage 0 sporulation protein A homolog n=1 Tax=Pseudobacteroides cellulosolvens ATCC 35603 = DSM 2933 TaxID=398512 RepID=A0A0L6JPN4_9FIRM|nr:response regulator [Pseudobacteroides cellulosolvens]KNY27337.1 response regulator receiver modulated diguanylate cyclase [Pseudobacteroides cellulosolvens ATCC 35603 = DSM 2933]
MFKKKILIVDDTELIVRIITDILVPAGYDVISAYSGEEGIEMVRREKPDLVLLDIIMYGMDGLEVCKVLRADESNNLMPIIILTAEDDEEQKLQGLELGADDYIKKPFNPRELIARVRNTLIRIDRNRWANPLTGLRGNLEIQSEITRRIFNRDLFTVVYADLDNFKAYNDVYGFASGDRAIKLTADILLDCIHTFGAPTDFVGHVGGDDFILVIYPQNADMICESIIKRFDKKIVELYSMEDRNKGFISTTNRQGQMIQYPIISISLAAVSNENRNLISHLQVAEIAAELKKQAKSIAGSAYVRDLRRNV